MTFNRHSNPSQKSTLIIHPPLCPTEIETFSLLHNKRNRRQRSNMSDSATVNASFLSNIEIEWKRVSHTLQNAAATSYCTILSFHSAKFPSFFYPLPFVSSCLRLFFLFFSRSEMCALFRQLCRCVFVDRTVCEVSIKFKIILVVQFQYMSYYIVLEIRTTIVT